MADSIDDDTLQAVQKVWASDQKTLPVLVTQPPQAGRLKSPQPAVYAHVDCELDSRELFGVVGAWADRRKVTITVYGRKADVVKGLAAVLAVFNLRTVLTYPSTDATGLPRFFSWWPLDGNELKQDPDTKAGEDIWQGITQARVWSTRLN